MGKKFDPKAALTKQGWSEGIGLGRNNDGIAEPLKAKLKHDMKGLGHDAGEQFTNCWWQQLFNTSAKNIDVNLSEKSEVKVSQQLATTEDYRSKKLSAVIPSAKTNLYSSFVKTSTLHGAEEVREAVVEIKPTATPSTDEDTEVKIFSDEALHTACGGRTAHKGARHGVKMNGKLVRLMRQEEIHGNAQSNGSTPTRSNTVSDSASVAVDDQSDDNVRAKSKKDKRKKRQNDDLAVDCEPDAGPALELPESPVEEAAEAETRKKQRRKKKSQIRQAEDETAEDITTAIESEPSDAADLNDIAVEAALQNTSGKKKKSKRTDACSELAVAEDDDALVNSKKKKSKRKHSQAEEESSELLDAEECDSAPVADLRKKKKKAV